MNKDDLLTLPDAAELLHCTQRTIWNYIRAGKLPAHKAAGRWILRRDDVIAFATGEAPADSDKSDKRKVNCL